MPGFGISLSLNIHCACGCVWDEKHVSAARLVTALFGRVSDRTLVEEGCCPKCFCGVNIDTGFLAGVHAYEELKDLLSGKDQVTHCPPGAASGAMPFDW